MVGADLRSRVKGICSEKKGKVVRVEVGARVGMSDEAAGRAVGEKIVEDGGAARGGALARGLVGGVEEMVGRSRKIIFEASAVLVRGCVTKVCVAGVEVARDHRGEGPGEKAVEKWGVEGFSRGAVDGRDYPVREVAGSVELDGDVFVNMVRGGDECGRVVLADKNGHPPVLSGADGAWLMKEGIAGDFKVGVQGEFGLINGKNRDVVGTEERAHEMLSPTEAVNVNVG